MAANLPRRLLAVCEANGAQGGSVIQAALGSGFAVRALVRDIGNDKARALRDQGVQVVRAHFREDDASSLAAAFAGAHAAFMVENFWENGHVAKEPMQACRLADAAKAAGVERCIFSTLNDPSSSQAVGCSHFRAIGMPTTFIVSSLYYEFFMGVGSAAPTATVAPQKVPGAHPPRLRLGLPMGRARLPAVALADIGRLAVALLLDPSSAGRTVGLAGDMLTGEQFAATFTRVLGVPTDYAPPSFDEFRDEPSTMAAELGNQFEAWHDMEAVNCALHEQTQARRYLPDLLAFEQWLQLNKHNYAYLLC